MHEEKHPLALLKENQWKILNAIRQTSSIMDSWRILKDIAPEIEEAMTFDSYRTYLSYLD